MNVTTQDRLASQTTKREHKERRVTELATYSTSQDMLGKIGKHLVQKVQKAISDEQNRKLIVDAEQFDEEKVKQINREYGFSKFHQKFASPSTYIKNVTHHIETLDLYEVVGICNFNQSNEYCPVLLRLGEVLKKHYREEGKDQCEYLLQVWDRQGKCLYERELELGRKLMNWFIKDNTFVWEEAKTTKTSESFLNLLRFKKDEKPFLISRRLNLAWDSSKSASEFLEFESFNSYRFQRICFVQDNFFFVRKNQIYYFDLSQEIKNACSSPETTLQDDQLFKFKVNSCQVICFCDIGQKANNSPGVCMIAEQDFNDFQNSFQIAIFTLGFQKAKASKQLELVNCGRSTKQLSRIEEFLMVVLKDGDKYCTAAVSVHKDYTATFIFDFKQTQHSKVDLHGRVRNITISTQGFYLKVQKCKKQLDENIKKGQEQLDDVLDSDTEDFIVKARIQARDHARWNADGFNIREESNMERNKIIPHPTFEPFRPARPFDEKTGLTLPFFNEEDQKFEEAWTPLKCEFKWKNKISMETCTPIAEEDTLCKYAWAGEIHKRAQMYMRLFTSFLTLQTFIVIAHRNMVSTYNLARKCWGKTFEYDDWVRQLYLGPSAELITKNDLLGSQPKEKHWYDPEVFQTQKNARENPDKAQFSSTDPKDQHFSVFLPIQHRLAIKVFVGRDLDGLNQLNYKKLEDSFNEGKIKQQWKEEQHENQQFAGSPHHIIQIACDTIHERGQFLLLKCEDPPRIMEKIGKDSFYQNLQKEDVDIPCILVSLFRGKLNLIADQDRIDQIFPCTKFKLDQRTQICTYSGADQEDDMEHINREIETRDVVTQIMVSSIEKSILITVKHQTIDEEKNEESRKYQFENALIEHPVYNTCQHDKLIGCAVFHDSTYGDDRYSLIRITKHSISIYDKDGDFQSCYLNMNIVQMSYIDDQYLYCITDETEEPVRKCTVLQVKEDQTNAKELPTSINKNGIWMLNLRNLVQKDQVEAYPLQESLLGKAACLQYAEKITRLCFLADYTSINLMPLLHRNTFHLLGMGMVQDYLIYRETPSFFIALHKSGMLQTWSNFTGELLYNNYTEDFNRFKNYSIYQADHEDCSHIEKSGQQTRKSISLIHSVTPYGTAEKDVNKSQTKSAKEATEIFSRDFSLAWFLGSPKKEKEDNNKNQLNYTSRSENSENENEKEQPVLDLVEITPSTGTLVKIKEEEKEDYQIYNFKVLQLSGSEDFSNWKCERTNMEAFKNKENKFAELFSFDFPLVKKGDLPKMYLSKDCTKLMTIEDKITVVIYHLDAPSLKQLYSRLDRINKSYSGESQWMPDAAFMASWEAKTIIHQFPGVMQGLCASNFLFSEDFERMLDFDYSTKTFVIKRIGCNVETLKPENNAFNLRTQNLKVTQNPFLSMDQIPSENFCLNFAQNRKSEDIVADYAKRICWKNKQCLEVVNDQGISCIIKFDDHIYKEWLKAHATIHKNYVSWDEKRYKQEMKQLEEGQRNKYLARTTQTKKDVQSQFELKSYCRIDNFIPESLEYYNHYMLESATMKYSEVMIRLFKHFQKMKIQQQHKKNYAKWAEDEEDSAEHLIKLAEKTKQDNLISKQEEKYMKEYEKYQNDKLIKSSVDHIEYIKERMIERKRKLKRLDMITQTYEVYYKSEGHDMLYFSCRMSFTAIDWILIYTIMNDIEFQLDKIDQMSRLRLCFNVFPRGGTAFHRLTAKPHEEASIRERIKKPDTASKSEKETLNQLQVINGLFQAAQKGVSQEFYEFKVGVPLEVPILENAFGNTILDMVLANDEYKVASQSKIALDPTMPDYSNMSMAAVIFNNIKDYQDYHSGPVIADAVIRAVEKEVPGIAEFIQSRFRESNYLSQVQNKIKNSRQLKDADQFTFQYYDKPIVEDGNQEKLKQTLFEKGKGTNNKKRIDQYLFDIPGLQQWNKQGRRFVRALSQINGHERDELFTKRVVQLIIERQWDDARWWYFGIFAIPFAAYIVLFFVWTLHSLDQYADANAQMTETQKILTCINLVISLYFILLEIQRCIYHYKNYFSDWSEILREGLAPLLILINSSWLLIHDYSYLPDGSSKFLTLELDSGEVVEYPFDNLGGNKQVGKVFWLLQATAVLAILIKGLKFLNIFENFAALSQQVIYSLVEVIPFMEFLTISVFAISSVFLMTSKVYIGNDSIIQIREFIEENPDAQEEVLFMNLAPDEKKFILGSSLTGTLELGNIIQAMDYTVNFLLGNLGDIVELDRFGMFMYVFVVLFLMLLLLNLLVSIVNSVYSEKTEFRYREFYQSKNNMLFELVQLWRETNQAADKKDVSKFLYVVSPLSGNNQLEKDVDDMTKLLDQKEKTKKQVELILYNTKQAIEEEKKQKRKDQHADKKDSSVRSVNALGVRFWQNELAKQDVRHQKTVIAH